ncbi:unnamed protein product, partial [Staurois parvus]
LDITRRDFVAAQTPSNPVPPHSTTHSSPLSHGPTTALTSTSTPPYIPHTEAPQHSAPLTLLPSRKSPRSSLMPASPPAPSTLSPHNSYDLPPPPSYAPSPTSPRSPTVRLLSPTLH